MDSVIAPVLQVKFRLMGCLVKGNALVSENRSLLSCQLILLLILRNSHLQGDVSANIFASIFVKFWKILAAHLKNVPKIFRKCTKKTPLGKFYSTKVAGFYRSSHRRCFLKEMKFYKIHRKTPVPETLFNKVARLKTVKKRLWRRREFCEISKNPFLTE